MSWLSLSPLLLLIVTTSNGSGYGYQTRIVEDLDNIDNDLAASMEWALGEIKSIQTAARSGSPIIKPRWPVLIMRTPKGWSGPKSFDGELIEGSFHSHQVPLPLAKTDRAQLGALQAWLASYKPEELFDEGGRPVGQILGVVPEVVDKKLGMRRESYKAYVPLKTPNWDVMCKEKGSQESCMKAVGRFLKEVVAE